MDRFNEEKQTLEDDANVNISKGMRASTGDSVHDVFVEGDDNHPVTYTFACGRTWETRRI